ncbi:hypothetical protein [Roseofilum sp. Belize BBD 4]|nr:hypothetical protein [Roseofilum sp. Belize BBD 4]
MLTNQSGINAVTRTLKCVALSVMSVVLYWSNVNLHTLFNV